MSHPAIAAAIEIENLIPAKKPVGFSAPADGLTAEARNVRLAAHVAGWREACAALISEIAAMARDGSDDAYMAAVGYTRAYSQFAGDVALSPADEENLANLVLHDPMSREIAIIHMFGLSAAIRAGRVDFSGWKAFAHELQDWCPDR